MATIKLGKEELSKIYADFAAGLHDKENICVEFDKVNNLDTLVIIRVMSDKPDVSVLAPVIEQMLDGSKITFTNNNKVIKTVYYNMGDSNRLHMMFTEEPYLYDILEQTAYALLLKKLTPHLEGSN